MSRTIALSALSLALFSLTALPGQAQTPSFDLLIRNGRVLDGTGNPWFYADIGIRAGRIAAVGQLDEATATRVIDAAGLVVAPGFIDIHSHADDGSRPEGGFRDRDARRRAAPNLVAQGVTTVVVNQDGRSPWPIAEQRRALVENKIGPNAVLLFGHGTIRHEVMKSDFRRPATPAEIEAIQALAQQAMEEGAFGMSAGLEYTPGRWSTTDEVVALMQVVGKHGGIYISHQRSEGADPMWYWPTQDTTAPSLLDAVAETIEIGERSGATVVATHIKTKGAHYWGTSHTVINLIQQARDRGVSVWADQYPYNTSGTDGNTMLIPAWAYGLPERFSLNAGERQSIDYARRLQERLAVADQSAKIRTDIAHEIRRRGGAEQIRVFDFPQAAWVGKTLAELAREHSVSVVEMAIKLQLDGYSDRRGGARLRGFSMSEADIEAYAAHPWVMTASDAGIALPDDRPVHARFYGTFPRKLRHYAMERQVLSVPDAVRSMTSLPAQVLGVRDRGQIREGTWADLVVLDLASLRDKATFEAPHQYPEGIVHVLVNGTPVVDSGQLTWALPGVVLDRRAAEAAGAAKVSD